jgi:peptide-methionine (R)-S-oxide reductase
MLSRRTFLHSGAAAAAALGLSPALARPRRFAVELSTAEWRRRLNPAAYAVLRQHATEQPGSSPLDNENRRGTFRCAGCAQPLFSSATKFDSRTGWPSFFAALPKAVGTQPDRSAGFVRTEVHCARCGGHLGHVFDDGPKPTGKRYCMNGVAMRFVPVSA